MSATHVLPDVVSELEAAWRRTDEIFSWIDEDAWFERPIAQRHRFLFYLGHLPAFCWNQVARGVLGDPGFRPAFDELFERGIDPLDDDFQGEDRPESWPSISEVNAYRDQVRERLLESVPRVRAGAAEDPLVARLRVYHIALEHELMHHETLLYMLHEFDSTRKRAPASAKLVIGSQPQPQEFVSIPAGRATLGARFEELEFGWDNEFEEHVVDVDAFEIERHPVTIGAYREFVEARGYEREEFWSKEDFAWIRSRGMRHPVRWEERDGTFVRRTLFSEVPLEDVLAWPVLTSYAEAKAYARFRGVRLPTEPEYHRAAYGTPGGEERAFPWGADSPTPEHGNFDFSHLDPIPIGSRPAGRSAFGVEELLGNGWEWTTSPFAPFPGFRAWARTYPGYSADFFDGEHRVLFGAAWPTHRRFLRRSFRNWFQEHYPYAFTTFRLARDSS